MDEHIRLGGASWVAGRSRGRQVKKPGFIVLLNILKRRFKRLVSGACCHIGSTREYWQGQAVTGNRGAWEECAASRSWAMTARWKTYFNNGGESLENERVGKIQSRRITSSSNYFMKNRHGDSIRGGAGSPCVITSESGALSLEGALVRREGVAGTGGGSD